MPMSPSSEVEVICVCAGEVTREPTVVTVPVIYCVVSKYRPVMKIANVLIILLCSKSFPYEHRLLHLMSDDISDI